jgi:hypothetical protein
MRWCGFGYDASGQSGRIKQCDAIRQFLTARFPRQWHHLRATPMALILELLVNE